MISEWHFLPAGVANLVNAMNKRRKAQTQVRQAAVCCKGNHRLGAT